MRALSILYRGPLDSCNYGCTYCPFAKKVSTRAELAADRRALERFVDWIARRDDLAIGVLFTPWGEGLVRPHYQEALVRLSNLPHVTRAAIQTNLSSSISWVDRAGKNRLALWATFHPEWTTRAAFVDKVRALDARGVRLSCGVVGFRRFAREIEALRAELPPRVYLWINAVKSGGEAGRGEPYAEEDIAAFERIDPLFRLNTHPHPSAGRSCRAGASVISVDGEGDVRRCHFIREVIGNLYDPRFEDALRERACTNATCGCHIGYVHLDELRLYAVFGDGVLERVPARRLPVLSMASAARISHA
jgi:MoaA/NifB/PqqE/SkfB family radical SAM enzyme